MLEEIKKGILSGLGAVVLTREKIEAVTAKLVEEAKLSKEEAQKLSDELFRAGERQWSDLEDSVKSALRDALVRLDVGSHEDFQLLKGKMENMEKRMAILESMAQTRREGKKYPEVQ